MTNSEDRGESIQHKTPNKIKETTDRADRDWNEVNEVGMSNSENSRDKQYVVQNSNTTKEATDRDDNEVNGGGLTDRGEKQTVQSPTYQRRSQIVLIMR